MGFANPKPFASNKYMRFPPLVLATKGGGGYSESETFEAPKSTFAAIRIATAP
jgi:hypothetical protein